MSSENENESYRMPSATCLQHAFKLAIVEDKEVKADYWTASLDKQVIEYTSPISKIYKVETEYIIVTENSIYLVSADIDSSRIS